MTATAAEARVLPADVVRRSYIAFRGTDDDWPIAWTCSHVEDRPPDTKWGPAWCLDYSPAEAERKASVETALMPSLGYKRGYIVTLDVLRGGGTREGRYTE